MRGPDRSSRRRTVLAAVLIALVAAAPAAWADDPPDGAGGAGGADYAAVDVLVVGDSLAVGMRRWLPDRLPGRRIRWDVKSGRTTPEGMWHLRRELERVDPQVVVVSLGTNDGPSGGRFSDRIRRTLRDIPDDACVVWADIIRPSRKGEYDALNRALRSRAERSERLHVVPWRRAVKDGDARLKDGLHPDRAGFRHRSTLYARAIERHC